MMADAVLARKEIGLELLKAAVYPSSLASQCAVCGVVIRPVYTEFYS